MTSASDQCRIQKGAPNYGLRVTDFLASMRRRGRCNSFKRKATLVIVIVNAIVFVVGTHLALVTGVP